MRNNASTLQRFYSSISFCFLYYILSYEIVFIKVFMFLHKNDLALILRSAVRKRCTLLLYALINQYYN